MCFPDGIDRSTIDIWASEFTGIMPSWEIALPAFFFAPKPDSQTIPPDSQIPSARCSSFCQMRHTHLSFTIFRKATNVKKWNWNKLGRNRSAFLWEARTTPIGLGLRGLKSYILSKIIVVLVYYNCQTFVALMQYRCKNKCYFVLFCVMMFKEKHWKYLVFAKILHIFWIFFAKMWIWLN